MIGMVLGPSGRKQEPLYVFRMVFALALAATLGGALGLAWHAVSFETGEETQITPPTE
jgi:hypothetical protein